MTRPRNPLAVARRRSSEPMSPTPRRPRAAQVDRVRVTIPVERQGNAEHGRSLAALLGQWVAAVGGAGFDVAYRVDTGLVITVDVARGRGPTAAGALFAAASVVTTLERALERRGNTGTGNAARTLEALIPAATIKVNGG